MLITGIVYKPMSVHVEDLTFIHIMLKFLNRHSPSNMLSLYSDVYYVILNFPQSYTKYPVSQDFIRG